MTQVQERFAAWRAAPGMTEQMQEELDRIAENPEELESRFGRELEFGTAGMRGLMGLGSNRLNRFTVRRAAQGMAAWLNETELPKRAAIGYDSRHNSRMFAEVCAVAFAEAGIEAYLYDRLAPTPMLSYAVRMLECGCGVVISASHNAGAYNGVKCYGPDGCQMTDEPAAVVTEKIRAIALFQPEHAPFTQYLREGKIRYIPQEIWEKYYARVREEALVPDRIRRSGLRVVYTPLCGTGNEPVRRVLGDLGAQVAVVACQEKPDGDFRTCEYPNPETDEALAESYRTALLTPCDVILGTDPDCDRVAIAVPDGAGFRKLSGNELGCVLLDYILSVLTEQNRLPEGAEIVRSIVTTPLTDRIAEHYGCKVRKVLTGFKYIGQEIGELEAAGHGERFIFGYEESCGYLKGTYARDKDAVVASMLVCEMAAARKLRGQTILDALEELQRWYGVYLTGVRSVELTGADAMEKAAQMMQDLRSHAPASIGGMQVTRENDYRRSVSRDTLTGEETEIQLPKSNVLEFILGSAGSIVVRPSGTEPKVKFYYTSIAPEHDRAREQMDAMIRQMEV